MRRCQERRRGAAWDDGLEGLVSAHAAGDLIDHLTKGDAHRHFVIARAFHVPTQAEDAGPRALGRVPDRGEPLGAPVHDMGDVRQRLYVVHHRWLLKQPMRGGKRWLGARQAPLPFHGFQQGGLLPANVRAGAAVHENVQGESRAQDVGTQVAGPVGFRDSVF